ncbi:MAG: hypothetical protein HQ559_05220 [Lentisphaerae bacterium]|nr:hypothetical protein [Lentisphaerota bacterium]
MQKHHTGPRNLPALLVLGALLCSFSGCMRGVDTAEEVRRIKDPTELARLAVEAEWASVREAAVEMLTDQDLLTKVALDAGDERVVYAAEKRITSRPHLARVAREAPFPHARKCAIRRLHDEDVLGTISQTDSEPHIRALALFRKMTHEDPRADSLPNHLVDPLLPAIELLMNPDVASHLGDITEISTKLAFTSQSYAAKSGRGGDIVAGEEFSCSLTLNELRSGLSATWRATFPREIRGSPTAPFRADVRPGDLVDFGLNELPQPLLERIAGDATMDESIRVAAAAELPDQSILGQIVASTEDRYIRRHAARRITDRRVLKSLALQEKSIAAAMMAVEMLNGGYFQVEADSALLAEIAVGAPEESVRLAAAKDLAQQDPLVKLARTAKDVRVRREATKSLTNQTALAALVWDRDYSVRRSAIYQLWDQALLAKVVTSARDWEVRRIACDKLTDRALVRQIAANDSDHRVREFASHRAGDDDLWTAIAERERDRAEADRLRPRGDRKTGRGGTRASAKTPRPRKPPVHLIVVSRDRDGNPEFVLGTRQTTAVKRIGETIDGFVLSKYDESKRRLLLKSEKTDQEFWLD